MSHKIFCILFKWETLGELLSSFVSGLPFVPVAGVVLNPYWVVISSRKLGLKGPAALSHGRVSITDMLQNLWVGKELGQLKS